MFLPIPKETGLFFLYGRGESSLGRAALFIAFLAHGKVVYIRFVAAGVEFVLVNVKEAPAPPLLNRPLRPTLATVGLEEFLFAARRSVGPEIA